MWDKCQVPPNKSRTPRLKRLKLHAVQMDSELDRLLDSRSVLIPIGSHRILIDKSDAQFVSSIKYLQVKHFINQNKTVVQITNKHTHTYKSLARTLLQIDDNLLILEYKNNNVLDLRRSNLEFTHKTLVEHRYHKNKGNTSQYRGVSWMPNKNRWRVYFTFNGQVEYLGVYRDEKEAAKAYDNRAREVLGELASTNFS